MQDHFFIVVSQDGVCKMTKKEPALKSFERGIKLNISVPDDVFEITYITANINVKQEDIMSPEIEILAGEALSLV